MESTNHRKQHLLKITFDIRAYADGTTHTDVIYDNSWMFTPGKSDLQYNVTISQNNTQVYSYNNIYQYLYSMWHHEVNSPGIVQPNVQYDVPYLISAGAILNYDLSIGVTDSKIQYNYTGATSNTSPMSTSIIDPRMPDPGGRQDIAPEPNWTAEWIVSQNATARATMMSSADAGGTVPWHFTDESTGKPINGETFTSFGYNTVPVNGWPNYGTVADPWKPDTAHEPDLNYLPYLVTGSHYQLDQLQAEADQSIITPYNYSSMGFASCGNQPRGLAWEMRTEAEAAWITPDSDSYKNYLVNELNKGMSWLVQQYITNNVNGAYGQLAGDMSGAAFYCNSYKGVAVPWEDSFIAMSLSQVAGMNIPQASQNALSMLKFLDTWYSGLFLNGPNGFNPYYATPYKALVNAGPVDGNGIPQGAPATTWSQYYTDNVQPTEWVNGGGFPPYPPDTFIEGPSGFGGFSTIARAGLAALVSTTGSSASQQAYNFAYKELPKNWLLKGLGSEDGTTDETGDYQNYPQFDIIPTPGTLSTNYPYVTISMTPRVLKAGQSATITWNATNATSCTGSGTGFTPTGTSGSVSVSPVTTTVYSLTCNPLSGAPGVPAYAAIYVAVGSSATSPDGTIIYNGTMGTLTTADGVWTFDNNSDLGALNEYILLNGSLTPNWSTGVKLEVANGGTLYGYANGYGWFLWQNGGFVSASDPNGTTTPTASLTASPSTITSGGSSTLIWSSTTTTSCTGSWTGSTLATSGSVPVSPTVTTTYSINCGGATASATVTVSSIIPPPTVSLYQDATTTYAGTAYTYTVTWSSTNATSCVVQKTRPDGGINPSWGTGISGSQLTYNGKTGTSVFLLTCSGTGGTASTSINHYSVNATGNASSQATLSFGAGARVTTTTNLYIRATPDKNGLLLCVEPQGATGTIVGNSSPGGGYVWWNVQFNATATTPACTGWAVQNYLTLQGAVAYTPFSGTITHTLAKGWTGPEVTALQSILGKLGTYTAGVTGYFGSLTKQAVEAF